VSDGQYLILAGTDNDLSVTQDAGSGTQFDELFNPLNIARIRCSIGTLANCNVVNADGALGGAYGGPFDNFALVPGTLYAHKSAGADLGSYVVPQISEPVTLAMFGLGIAALGLVRRGRIGEAA
jgi:hypothetical protein